MVTFLWKRPRHRHVLLQSITAGHPWASVRNAAMFEGGVNKDASVFTSCVKNDENTSALSLVCVRLSNSMRDR